MVGAKVCALRRAGSSCTSVSRSPPSVAASEPVLSTVSIARIRIKLAAVEGILNCHLKEIAALAHTGRWIAFAGRDTAGGTVAGIGPLRKGARNGFPGGEVKCHGTRGCGKTNCI